MREHLTRTYVRYARPPPFPPPSRGRVSEMPRPVGRSPRQRARPAGCSRHSRTRGRYGSVQAPARAAAAAGAALRRSLPQFEVLEAFGYRKTLAGGHLGSPFADRLLQLGPVAHLALVFAEGLDLEVDGVADVH